MDCYRDKINALVTEHNNCYLNVSRRELIGESVDNGCAVISSCGALVTWTPPESTGRSPKDTYVVESDKTKETVDWSSPNNIPLSRETFDMVLEDALAALQAQPKLFVTERVIGADSSYALPVRTTTDFALTALFTDNVFRPVPDDIEQSCFSAEPFELLSCPYHKLDKEKYKGRLREINGETSDICVAMDFERRIGVVFGSAYGGSNKKMLFTVMNYLLPEQGILPLHCSANEGEDGSTALLLGLSGTGKTTLSADPERALLGDDEHGWAEDGIANFENGCYAKLINIKQEKEPEIYDALFHDANHFDHGAIIENCMMYPDGHFDFDDERLTQNSRGSYPLSFLKNIKPSSKGSHPSTIIFLTADANGVIPPVAKLSKSQAMLWFLMGYTSKLAGTETGITEPVSTFSRFFGEPFMPRNPKDYTSLLGRMMEKHETSVFLINTGWSGGPYGVGKRMDINLTRAIVNACLSGSLNDVEYVNDETFKVSIPKTCPGVTDPSVLNPVNTWTDKAAFEERAQKLAKDFAAHFEKAYGTANLSEEIASQCPGK